MSARASTVSQQLATWAAGLRDTALPAGAEHAACRAYLDWYASVAAGSRRPPAAMARAAMPAAESPGSATLIPDHGTAAAPAAAFANGVAGHILELDDLHQPSTIHPAAPIIAAAAATAEAEGASGAALVAAITAGFEVALRIGEAVNPSHYRFWHPTGTIATFGAATGAGLLMGLPAHQLDHALGSAGTQAAGLWEFNADGAMSKHLHPGHAALTGVLSARLARAGFTGASRILEGDRGVLRAMAEDADPAAITRDLGASERLRIEDDSFKLYPCCGHTHAGIDLALEASATLAPKDIEAVTIDAYRVALDICAEPEPATPYQARFSYPYVVACALLYGVVDLDSFTEDQLRDGDLRRLAGRVRLRHEPGLDEVYPGGYPARLTVTTRDGGCWEASREHPRGTPHDPLSDEELTAKAATLLGGPAAEALRRHAFALPQLAVYGVPALE